MSTKIIEQALASGTSADAILKASALQAASPIVLALAECDEDLRAEALELFKQLHSGDLDEGERFATLTLLAEILFPPAGSQTDAGTITVIGTATDAQGVAEVRVNGVLATTSDGLPSASPSARNPPTIRHRLAGSS